jgi:hypothetical protein
LMARVEELVTKTVLPCEHRVCDGRWGVGYLHRCCPLVHFRSCARASSRGLHCARAHALLRVRQLPCTLPRGVYLRSAFNGR